MAKTVISKEVWTPRTRDELPPEGLYLGGSDIQEGWAQLEQIFRRVITDNARAYRQICPGGEERGPLGEMVVNELVRMCLPEIGPTEFDPPYNPKRCQIPQGNKIAFALLSTCLLYTSDAADDM
eukprot:2476599-Lingulodinium_polyedra.AAC.1